MRTLAGIAVLAALANCAVTPSVTIEQIQANGGRVAWYKGTAAGHDLIAFDRMNPDGSNVLCLTCANPDIPKGFIGQPEWHPDGQHLVIQAENGNSTHERYNHVAWGINQDLWIVGIDGTGAEKIYDNSASPNLAALHPHFSADGTRLIFAERIATGVDLGLDTPGGENPWAGWRIHVADDPGKRYLISDYHWDRTGRRIVLQVAPVDDAMGTPYSPETVNGEGFACAWCQRFCRRFLLRS